MLQNALRRGTLNSARVSTRHKYSRFASTQNTINNNSNNNNSSNNNNTLKSLFSKHKKQIFFTSRVVGAAGGMFAAQNKVWEVSPYQTPKKHINSVHENYVEDRYTSAIEHIRAQDDQYADWVERILKQEGKWVKAEDLDPADRAKLEEREKKDRQFIEHLDDVYDKLDRIAAQPDNYVWCQDYLKDIFRFSSEEGCKKVYRMRLGTDGLKNMIRWKTFIEKEKYKLYRDRDSLLEMQVQFLHNIGGLLDILSSQQQDFRENENQARADFDFNEVYEKTGVMNPFKKPYENQRYVHPVMQPIYSSLEHSARVVIDMFDYFKPIIELTAELDKNAGEEWTKNGDHSKALEISQQHAAIMYGVVKTTRSLTQFFDDKLYDFEEYYTPERVRNLIEYARLEAQPKKRHYLDSVKLPEPPSFDMEAMTFYTTINDNIEGMTGSWQPDSWPYHPIEHVPLTERLLNPEAGPPKLTPEERNLRWKLNNQDAKVLEKDVQELLVRERMEVQIRETQPGMDTTQHSEAQAKTKMRLDGQISINERNDQENDEW